MIQGGHEPSDSCNDSYQELEELQEELKPKQLKNIFDVDDDDKDSS
jgi:hypothetical protein